ncbi:MAG TPA: hypothetical protein VK363_07670 [Pyrinomonadaceae bacterium]|nr:hypothetical protein [Pyrinomonadaceae bacterium]
MHIQQRRIRNIERHLHDFKINDEVYIGLVNLAAHKARLGEVGFTGSLTIGETVLPTIFGPITRFNAEGKDKVRRDLPKETTYRQQEWHWTEWDGTENSRIVDVPYQRYPRERIPPPSKQLQVVNNAKGNKVVASDLFKYSPSRADEITHTINLFLEIFGECDVLREDLVPVVPIAIKRLNWKILPQGKYPWEKLYKHVQPILDRAKKGKVPIIQARLSAIAKENPEFVAIGESGFNGYMVFGFPNKKLYVLESAYYGNATYVFDKNWEQLSKMTKAEILDGGLQKDRIIHREGWTEAIDKLLS